MKEWLSSLLAKCSAKKKVQSEESIEKDESCATNGLEHPTTEEPASAMEPAVLDGTDAELKTDVTKKRKKWSVRKKAIVFSVIGVFAVLIITCGVWALNIMADPLAQFNNTPDADPTVAHTGTNQPNQEDTPTPTIDPEALLLSMADRSILEENYINIMLIGVDQSEERKGDDWKGKTDFHSDVMIVLTINKMTHDVSMISLPRDTYAKIPGVDGIYKLNASINCGGGWCDDGFKKVCQAAQWMLGGDGAEDDPIQIDYYFAVDMGAVKQLADSIGGVDYDLDISFTIQGRSYTKGPQHMNGQAVLDYLRVRKEATGSHEGISEEDANNAIGDKNRVNRQKRMLVAIFQKIKDNGLLASIPNLIGAFDGNLKYNMSVNQIAALAYFALKYVDQDMIKMYSMSGSYVKLFEPYAFTFTNQSNRIDIIKEVYGVTVKARSYYTMGAAKLRWGKMQAQQYTKLSKPILSKVKALLDADAILPDESTPTPAPTPTPTPPPPPQTSETPLPSESASPPATESVSPPLSDKSISASPVKPLVAVAGFKQYGDTEWALYNKAHGEYEKLRGYDDYRSGDELLTLLEQYKADVLLLCNRFGIAAPRDDDWNYDYVHDYNDIYVDFR